MKKTILVFICLAIVASTYAQSLGIIKVNENYSATCEFEADVNNIYISNNELIETITNSQGSDQRIVRLYDYIVDGKTVIFSTYKELQAKSVTIKLSDGSTWYGIIEYDKENKQIYYPFYNQKKNSKRNTEIEDSLTVIKKRLSYCLSKKTNFQSFGMNKNRIYWEISNMMTDENFTYIKIVVNNRSGHEYKITNGRALFKYEEGKSRNLKKKEAKVEVDGIVSYWEGKSSINAYSSEILGYVIQSYPLNNNGSLIIEFMEYEGKRNYEINIPFKYIQKLEVFND